VPIELRDRNGGVLELATAGSTRPITSTVTHAPIVTTTATICAWRTFDSSIRFFNSSAGTDY
jgi:hypothetical protein